MNQYLNRLTRITGGSLARILTVERMNAMQDAIRALANGENLTLGNGLRKGMGDGRLRIDLTRNAGENFSGGICPFGEIITIPDSDPIAKGIRGGIVYCGLRRFVVKPFEIPLTANFDRLYYLNIECVSLRDDDQVTFLPGIDTSDDHPDSFFQWKDYVEGDDTQYDDDTPPGLSDGIGTSVIPLGRVTVTGAAEDVLGAARFFNIGCGNILMYQQEGRFYFSRVDRSD